jgi:Smg protein
MKETILDVLPLPVSKTTFYDDPDAVRDRDSLQAGLIQAGFQPHRNQQSLRLARSAGQSAPDAGRAARERAGPGLCGSRTGPLDQECLGFLMFLEQHGVLDADQRELVLDRAMALGPGRKWNLDDLMWVVLIVLFNQPGAEAAFAWMENQMFGEWSPEPSELMSDASCQFSVPV